MARTADFLESHHIQLALATGASIISLAYVSKRILPEPIDSLAMAVPPFLAVIGEGLIARCETSWYGKSWLWVTAILLATVFVIAWHLG
jgi:hypothetical protein